MPIDLVDCDLCTKDGRLTHSFRIDCRKCSGTGKMKVPRAGSSSSLKKSADRVVKAAQSLVDTHNEIQEAIDSILKSVGLSSSAIGGFSAAAQQASQAMQSNQAMFKALRQTGHQATFPPLFPKEIPMERPAHVQIKTDAGWIPVRGVSLFRITQDNPDPLGDPFGRPLPIRTHMRMVIANDRSCPGQQFMLSEGYDQREVRLLIGCNDGDCLELTAISVQYNNNPVTHEFEIEFRVIKAYHLVGYDMDLPDLDNGPKPGPTLAGEAGPCHVCGKLTVVRGSQGRPEHPTCAAWG